LSRSYIVEGLRTAEAEANGHAEPLPVWYKLLQNKAFLAIVVGHTCHNYGWFVLLSWLPRYLSSELGIPTRTVGYYAVVPYICMFVFDNVWGYLVDGWIAKGMRTVTARKLSQVQDWLLPARRRGDCWQKLDV